MDNPAIGWHQPQHIIRNDARMRAMAKEFECENKAGAIGDPTQRRQIVKQMAILLED